MKNTKNTFISGKRSLSILAAALMLAAGSVHAQTGSSTGGARSGQTGKTPAKSGTAVQKSQRNSGWYEYVYGKDPGRDYTRLQGTGPSGENSHVYGKDTASDYARSQGMGKGTSGGQSSPGTGSSSSQSDYD